MVWGRGLILLFSMWIQVVLMEKNPQGNSKISLLLCGCLDFRFIFESVLAFCVFLGICLFHLGCLINWHIIVTVLSCFSHVWLSVTLWSVALCPWDSLGKNTGVGCHALLRGIFLTQGSNPYLQHRWLSRQVLYPLSHLGSLKEQCCWNPGLASYKQRQLESIA